MSSSTSELTNTAYDILKVLGKDADFIYDTIETLEEMDRKKSWYECVFGKDNKKVTFC